MRVKYRKITLLSYLSCSIELSSDCGELALFSDFGRILMTHQGTYSDGSFSGKRSEIRDKNRFSKLSIVISIAFFCLLQFGFNRSANRSKGYEHNIYPGRFQPKWIRLSYDQAYGCTITATSKAVETYKLTPRTYLHKQLSSISCKECMSSHTCDRRSYCVRES